MSMASDTAEAPSIKKVSREQYYKENEWDGAEMFNTVASMVYEQDPTVTELLKVARRADQVLWLSGVPLARRQQLISKHDLKEYAGAVALLHDQLGAQENRVMEAKQQRKLATQGVPHMAPKTPTNQDEGCQIH